MTDAEALLAPWRTRWSLVADGPAFTTASSALQPVRADGRPAFLKVALVGEEALGGGVMRWWAGRGAAEVLRAADNAILLERAEGARSLVSLAASGPEGDEEATRILCRTALRLHSVSDEPRPPGLVDLARWFRDLRTRAETHPAAHGGLFARAAVVADDLLREPRADVVLHGDIHHGNVLDFGDRGWRAIDPKHLHGDPAFDFVNITCNPDLATATSAGRLERTLQVVSEETGLDVELLSRWTVAWCGLSASWSELGGGDARTAVAVGLRALGLLER